MADKAKFAYGSLAGLQGALDAGKVDAFDLLCLIDDGVARIGWVDKSGVPQIVSVPEDDVLLVDALPETGKLGIIYIVGEVAYLWTGTQFIVISESTDLTSVKERLAALEEKASSLEELVKAMESEVAAKVDADEANARYLSRKYEIAKAPVGTLVDYREKEIRVMCPADTEWTLQNVGSGGLKNRYYITFKAYAPEGAVSFKEDIVPVIEDQTMWYFENNSSAGIDKYGRKYSVCWLSVAEYDEASDTWTYFGAESTADEYVHKHYAVEWYDADGVIIASDYIRINLTNEDCHLNVEPYYVADVMQTIEEKIDAKIEEIAEIPVVEF